MTADVMTVWHIYWNVPEKVRTNFWKWSVLPGSTLLHYLPSPNTHSSDNANGNGNDQLCLTGSGQYSLKVGSAEYSQVITWKKGMGQICLAYTVNYTTMINKFLKIRLKLETECWPYWSPIHRYISILRVMKQMNYFFVSLDSVCFLGLFLPVRIDT